MVSLSTSWRHRDDPRMAEFLRLLRNTIIGPIPPALRAWPRELWELAIESRQHAAQPDWVILTATNRAQRNINSARMHELPGEAVSFRAVDSRPNMPTRLASLSADGNLDPGAHGSQRSDQSAGSNRSGSQQRDDAAMYEPVLGDAFEGVHVLSSVVAAPELSLKVGCQVIANANLADAGVPNGSRGVVIGFRSLDSPKEEDRLDDAACLRKYNCDRRVDVDQWWGQMNEGRRWPEVEFTVISHDAVSGGLISTKKVLVVPPRRFEVSVSFLTSVLYMHAQMFAYFKLCVWQMPPIIMYDNLY